ncbi:MAG: hypothetical protein EAZ51_09645 [Sphingobacteriales bacterium]|nr:MAG: hypothetical protein EAZ64_04890 [Sphingobacteriales bacterium]TAF78364.1 MAG: hypothetical protein EAZ51_09645 [Sphingobacteriales bacterium]
MKNINSKIFFLFALCGCLASCKKNDEQKYVFFPEKLYLKNISKQSEVRLFTKNREITNTDTIANFIKNEPNFNLQIQSFDASQTLVFESKSVAQIGNPKQAYDLNSDFVIKKTEFLFFSQKSIAVNPQDLTYILLKVKPPLVTVGTAPNLIYTTKEVKVAKGSYLNLNFSALSYKIKHANGLKQGTIYNQLISIDAAFLAKLQTTDTVAVQEFIYNYKTK